MFSSVKVGGRGKPDVLVIGKFAKTNLDATSRGFDADGVIAAAAARVEGSGETGKIAEAFPTDKAAAMGAKRVIIVGLGNKDAITSADLRTVGAAVGRRIAQTKDVNVRIELGGALSGTKVDARLAGRAFGEAFGLLGWKNDTFKGKGTPAPSAPKAPVVLFSGDEDFQDGMEYGVALAESVNYCRSLSDTPPNIATPDYIAQLAQKLARETGMQCRVFRGRDLERERFTGLLNVGKASENEPCMIRLEYNPGRGRASKKKSAKKGSARNGRNGGEKPIVLVGKTMTYDTGGLSLKINNGMVGMKRDKDGGCAVLGAMHAIATLVRPDVPVVALLASAENSISDEAYRPDDILTYRNGVTVEVTNTDAEGRLVLADALCWACDEENPACIVELSTLTGGVVTALGSTFAGMFCEDDALRDRLAEAMRTSGERWWRLPLDKEYRDMMKSPIADILNSNPNRKAHPIQGAAFLTYFVQDGIPFAHIDIAGVHATESDSGPFVKGPTGWGVRLLADFVASR